MRYFVFDVIDRVGHFIFRLPLFSFERMVKFHKWVDDHQER